MDNVLDIVNLEENQDKEIWNQPNPLSNAKKKQNFPRLGKTLQSYIADGGSVFSMHAKRTAIRSSYIQPSIVDLFPNADVELFGMLASTLSLQSEMIVMMLMDLILCLLPRSCYFNTRTGYKINFNLMRLYSGETCQNKSRLKSYCFDKPIDFLVEEGYDIGLYTGSFVNDNLMDIVAEKGYAIMFEDELTLQIMKARKSTKKESMDNLRLTINLLNDGTSIKPDDITDNPCKFNLIGFGQVQPTIDILQSERGSGDASTRK